MQNLDAKKMALMMLRKKLRKMELEGEMGGESMEQDENLDQLSTDEKGTNNQAMDAMEEAEAVTSAEGEDGEKEISIEMEVEGADETDTQGMEELYKKMAADFGSMPASREAAGKKKGLFATGGNGPMAMMKKGRK